MRHKKDKRLYRKKQNMGLLECVDVGEIHPLRCIRCRGIFALDYVEKRSLPEWVVEDYGLDDGSVDLSKSCDWECPTCGYGNCSVFGKVSIGRGMS